MKSGKVVINRTRKKKSPLERYIARELYCKLDNPSYKEIHIFKPSSRQEAQVVGFQGERHLSVSLLLHHPHPMTLQGAIKSWPPQISARAWRVEARQQDQHGGSRAKGKVKEMRSAEIEADSPVGGEPESKPHI